MSNERGNFGSKIGIVLATAGSAVGLGNVWRFPYMVGEDGGAAFILVYIICILLLGLPGMICEFIVGRHAQANAAAAYDKLSGGRPWKLVGYLGILTSTIILGFYAVVAGWCLQYLYAALVGQLSGDANYVKDYFVSFSSSPVRPILFGVAFILPAGRRFFRFERHFADEFDAIIRVVSASDGERQNGISHIGDIVGHAAFFRVSEYLVDEVDTGFRAGMNLLIEISSNQCPNPFPGSEL